MDETGTVNTTQNEPKRRRVKKKPVNETVGDNGTITQEKVDLDTVKSEPANSIERFARKLQSTDSKGADTAALLDNQDGSKQPTPADSEQPTPTKPKTKQKTKRAKSKQRAPARNEDADADDSTVPDQNNVSEAEATVDGEATVTSGTAKSERRRKRRKSPVKDSQPSTEVPPLNLNDQSGGETQRSDTQISPISNIEDRILAVTVHRTDRLKPDLFLAHPVVRVHLVDETTGNYIRKSATDRPVTSHYEPNGVQYVMPIITRPFDFKERRSTLPVWDEQLVFNESFAYLVNAPSLTTGADVATPSNHKLMLFFELLEFVNYGVAAKRYNSAHESSGFHTIGWAFLKVASQTGSLNVGKRLRLQLYNPLEHRQTNSNVPDVYQWWKYNAARREPYPSTLHVSISAILPPKTMQPALRSLAPLQPEEGSQPAVEFLTMHDPNATRNRLFGQLSPRNAAAFTQHWSKLDGQMFRIPNTQVLSLSGSPKGCIRAKFSRNGTYLACAQQETADVINIIIYQFPSGKLLNRLTGHSNIVYDLSWSPSDTFLLSVSSDCTARLWNVPGGMTLADRVLTHPSYVYCGQFHPICEEVMVTGAFDKSIRIWQVDLLTNNSPKLIQVVDEHRGHINALCFNDSGTLMCSGDSIGSVKVWKFDAQQDDSGATKLGLLTLNHDAKNDEFKDVPVNKLQLVHSDNRLIIHTRDSIIRLYDLRLRCVAKRYIGAMNYKEHLHSTVTPCGTFLFAASEDTNVYVWNIESGDHVATYTQLGFRNAAFAIDFHPLDNYIVFSSLGAEVVPVLVYFYDMHIAKQHVGIEEVEPIELLDAPPVAMQTVSPRLSATGTFRRDESPRPGSGMNSARNWETFAKVQQSRVNSALDRLNAAVRTAQNTTIASQLRTAGGLQAVAQATSASATLNAAADSIGIRDPKRVTAQQALRLEQSVLSRPGSAISAGRMTLDMEKSRPQFTFKPPRMTGTLDATDAAEIRERVVALYDYNAQRSDELTFKAGDIITILYHDTENWWMGEMAGAEGVGTVQGFVPSNYVAVLQAAQPAPTTVARTAGRSSLRGGGNEMTAVTDRFGKVSIVDTSRKKQRPPTDAASSSGIPLRSLRSNLVTQNANEMAQHSDSALGGSTASSANASPAQTDSRRNSGRRVRLSSGTGVQESMA